VSEEFLAWRRDKDGQRNGEEGDGEKEKV
jgi:hypothetical protein